MSVSSDYNVLLNKFNRLVASHKDLEQQNAAKTNELRSLERDTNITLGHVRNLCEEILAKDPNEMVLGRGYSWGSLPINVLVQKAASAFKVYNAGRTDLMKRLYSESEQRRIENEGLQSQIESLMINGRSVSQPKSDDYEETGEIEPDKINTAEITPIDDVAPVNSESIRNAPYKIQQAVKSGAIEAIIEEDNDLTDRDEADINEAVRLSDALTSQMKDIHIPVHPSNKKAKQQHEHEEKKAEAFMVNLTEYKEKMTDIAWLVLDAIGAFGLSRYAEIETKTIELFESSGLREEYIQKKKSVSITGGRVRTTIQSMENLGVVQREVIATPMISKLIVYSLAPMGTHLYKDKTSKDPVLSERDKVVAEHDNIEHGFSIRAVAEMFETSGHFKSVCCDPAKNRMVLEGDIVYVPDIVTQGKFKNYYEYERGLHIQNNFNIKMNKVCKVTNFVNIITSNKENVAFLSKQVRKWIESRGGYKALSGKKVRITTAISLKDKNPDQTENWNLVYDMKSENPIDNTARRD
jgi:hypothetical protein